MSQRNQKNNKSNGKKDNRYDLYVKNLGNTGTFYKNKKDSKGVSAVLVSISKDGVYGTVKGHLFPVFFERADFGVTGSTFKCTCGKTFEVREISSKKGRDSKKSNKAKKGNSYSDNGGFGEFAGSNGAKKSKAMTTFVDAVDGLDYSDDDDYEVMVEKFKKALRAFKN